MIIDHQAIVVLLNALKFAKARGFEDQTNLARQLDDTISGDGVSVETRNKYATMLDLHIQEVLGDHFGWGE